MFQYSTVVVLKITQNLFHHRRRRFLFFVVVVGVLYTSSKYKYKYTYNMGSPKQHKAATAKKCAVFFLVVILYIVLSSVTLSNNVVKKNYYIEYTPETRRIASRVSLAKSEKQNNRNKKIMATASAEIGTETETEMAESMEIDSEAAVDITTTTTPPIRAEDVEMGDATANNEKETKKKKKKEKTKSKKKKTTGAASNCPPKPPDAINRHGKAWVHINNYTVTKFPGFGFGGGMDYFHEKKVSQLLSPYPNFVTLLSWNDACGLLVFERLFPSKGFPQRMTPKLENWTAVEDQIHDIWEVLERHHINPSLEFLMGFNNIFIGIEGNVTMFDFHAYRYKGDGIVKPPFSSFSMTFRMQKKHRLLESLRIKRKIKHF